MRRSPLTFYCDGRGYRDDWNLSTVVAAVRDDAAISAKVSSALAADLSLEPADIKVDTKDGLVTLSGNVDTASLRMHAKEVAARQQGVVGVIDNIAVVSQG